MHNLFNPEGRVMQFLGKLFDLLMVNLLWVICSIPIVTIGAATAALYKVCFNIANNEDEPLFRTFFQSFAKNFKQATILWIILLGILIFLAFDIYVVYNTNLINSNIGPIVIPVLVFLILVWMGITLYTFALQMRYSLKIKRVFYNAGLFCLAYIPRTVIMIVSDVVLLALGLRYMPLLFVSVPALINSYLMHKVFVKHEPTQEEKTEEFAEG